MRLQSYLRSDFASKIRPLFIKEQCERCDCTNELELHHITPFSVLLQETLDELDLDYINETEDISDKELLIIKNIMRGKQLDSGYMTICKECHTKLHEEEVVISRSNYKAVELRKRKEKIIEDIRIQEEVIPYLESMIGIRLLGKEQTKVFSEKLGIKTDRGIISNSYNFINKKFEELNLNFLIKSSKTNLKNKEKINSYRYWVVEKLN